MVFPFSLLRLGEKDMFRRSALHGIQGGRLPGPPGLRLRQDQAGGRAQREPDCADALFVKGWILEYDDHKPEEAVAVQEKALKLNPELSEFWEKRGHFIESQLPGEAFSHFDIQFYGAEDRGKAWDAAELSERHV